MKVTIDKNIEGLVPLFFNKRQEDIALLKNFIKNHDYSEVKKVGHRVSGTAGNYGFLDLADIARSMEVAAHEKDDERLEELLNDFKNYVSTVHIEFI